MIPCTSGVLWDGQDQTESSVLTMYAPTSKQLFGKSRLPPICHPFATRLPPKFSRMHAGYSYVCPSLEASCVTCQPPCKPVHVVFDTYSYQHHQRTSLTTQQTAYLTLHTMAIFKRDTPLPPPPAYEQVTGQSAAVGGQNGVATNGEFIQTSQSEHRSILRDCPKGHHHHHHH
jgi:hypothetical protein